MGLARQTCCWAFFAEAQAGSRDSYELTHGFASEGEFVETGIEK